MHPPPKRVKRHLSPPPIIRPGGQYESEDEKVLKGPKVVQLLRTIVALKKAKSREAPPLCIISLGSV